jgi:hypothetical protein
MSHTFYHIMNYPVPSSATQFSWLEEDNGINNTTSEDRSREQDPSEIMSIYLGHIQSYARLYRSIPFVEQIYLCNSITFNALHEESDIDILIITKPGMLWLARLWSWMMFSVIWLKRFGCNKKMKFCLSYYIDREYCNIYRTALQPYDVYLCYWIAHLVPLYSANTSYMDEIYTSNRWITHFLPNIQLSQNISLGIDLITGETRFKRIIEKLIVWLPWVSHIYISLIKAIRLPILSYKTHYLGDKWRGIIISDTMLKFYHDRRKRVNYQYKQATTPFEKKENYDDESLF